MKLSSKRAAALGQVVEVASNCGALPPVRVDRINKMAREVPQMDRLDLEALRKDDASHGPWSWSDCEWAWACVSRPNNAKVVCVEVRKGEEMEACGRVSLVSRFEIPFTRIF